MKLQANEATHGFTLIEIMVAVSLFAIVAVITTGALVTASEVNRKAQAIKIAMDNVSFAMDSMVFNLREGADFGCLDVTVPDNPSGYFSSAGQRLGRGCTSDGVGIIFTSKRAGSGQRNIIYRLDDSGGLGSIQMASSNDCSPSAGSCFTDLTSSEVDISYTRFYIPGNLIPGTPRVTIVIRGNVPGKTSTEFNLQTTVKANF